MSKRDLAHDLFQSYKTGFTKKKKVIEERTQTPGDPTLIANVLSDLIQQRDWDSGLAEGTLFATWAQVANKVPSARPESQSRCWMRSLRTLAIRVGSPGVWVRSSMTFFFLVNPVL